MPTEKEIKDTIKTIFQENIGTVCPQKREIGLFNLALGGDTPMPPEKIATFKKLVADYQLAIENFAKKNTHPESNPDYNKDLVVLAALQKKVAQCEPTMPASPATTTLSGHHAPPSAKSDGGFFKTPGYEDVFSVSVYKPLGYMEVGEYQSKRCRPRCLAYIRPKILEALLEEKDRYVMTSRAERHGGILHEVPNPPKNKNLILVSEDEKDESEKIAGCALVFHLRELTKLLQLNKEMVADMLKLPKTTGITEAIAIKFAKLISREKEWKNAELALIQAAFADPEFLQNKAKDKVKLTDNLQLFFNEFVKRKLNFRQQLELIQQLKTSAAALSPDAKKLGFGRVD